MLGNFILICYLFIILSAKKKESAYLPLEKESTYGEDVCQIYEDGHSYVRPCNKGSYCLLDTLNSLGVCHEMEKGAFTMKDFGEQCSKNSDCLNGWSCLNGKCTCSSNTYCNDCFVHESGSQCTYKPNAKKSTSHCIESKLESSGTSISLSDSFDYFYLPYSSELKNQICGKLTLEDLSVNNNNYYYIKYWDYVYIGTVEDGEFVTDEKLCKSGYAIPYNPNDNDKYLFPTFSYSISFKQCITPISSESDNNNLKYEIKGEEYFYRNFGYDGFIKIKSERYREYVTKLNEDNELKEKCSDLDGQGYYTCENDELIKLWYFYKFPKDYIVYNGREGLEKVLSYLIQKEYPNYYSSSYFNKFLFIQTLALLVILF